MLHKETHDEDLDDLDINKNDYTDDDDIDGEEENITLSKSEYDAMQKKLGKLEKNVKHHKERRRQETQNVPDVSELVQKEIQMIQERQKVQATYPNVDIAKAEVTARQKGLSLEQAVFAEFGKEIMESRSSGGFSMGGSLHQDKKSNGVPEHLKQYIPKEFQKEIQK